MSSLREMLTECTYCGSEWVVFDEERDLFNLRCLDCFPQSAEEILDEQRRGRFNSDGEPISNY